MSCTHPHLRLTCAPITNPWRKEDALRNLAFLKDYAEIEMPPRMPPRKVQIDESLLHSGDMLGIVRLDGLDPLIMWGTGSRLGHTAIVLKGEDGLAYVAESQDKTSYWPRASIQVGHGAWGLVLAVCEHPGKISPSKTAALRYADSCFLARPFGRKRANCVFCRTSRAPKHSRPPTQKTPFAEWLSMADAADYNVVWMPLSRDARARFNQSAALEAFDGDQHQPSLKTPNLRPRPLNPK